MRLITLIVASLFLISLVTAEQITLLEAQSTTYKGIDIKLVNVGTAVTAAVLQVGNTKKPISKNREEDFGDITISLIELTEDTATIEITQKVECLINEDCDDNKPCTENICTGFRECSFRKTQGCELNNECKPTGSFADISNKLVYCNSNFEWKERKPKDSQCESNYECLSNLCENNLCTKPVSTKSNGGEEKMAPLWLVILFGIILLIKGIFFLYDPKKAKNLIRNLSYLREKNLRIFGIIAVVIGIILIVWALA
ncbi:MAG: DUF2065 family protein [Candidatus Woesearchaeota archaeon]